MPARLPRRGDHREPCDRRQGGDANVCVGCKVCTIACPFGTINYSADTGKVVKCDLCGGNPQCAEACPTGAITYVDASWTGLARMQASAVAAHGQPGA